MKKRLLPLLLSLGLLAGCGSPPAESASGESAGTDAPLSPVYADWSKLTEYQPPEERCTRRYDALTERLLPAEDYGPLLPYVGAVSGSRYTSVEKYGLITLSGEIVVDPVYTNVYQPSFYDYGTGGGSRLPLWVLERSVQREDGDWEERISLASLDGRWCTEPDYIRGWTADEETYFLLDTAGDLYTCDLSGRLTRRLDGGAMTEKFGRWWFESGGSQGSLAVLTLDTEADTGSALVDLFTGETTYLPEVRYSEGWYGDQWAVAWAREQGSGYLRRDGTWAIPPQFRSAESFRGTYASVILSDGTGALIDREGTPVLKAPEGQYILSWISAAGDPWYLLSSRAENDGAYTSAVLYDGALRDITPSWVTPETRVRLSDGSLWTVTAGTLRLFDGTRDIAMDVPEGFAVAQADLSGDSVLLQNDGYDDAACYALNGEERIPAGTYSYISEIQDASDGARYLLCHRPGGDFYDLYSQEGRLLAEGIHYTASTVSHGLIHVNDGFTDGYRMLNGDWVFRIRIQDSGD